MNQIEAKKQKIEYYSHIIGLISFILLGYLTGSNGVAYMAVIIECISLFVLVAGGCSCDVIGRLLRNRRKKGQYIAAKELFRVVAVVQTCAAVLLMLLYFLLSGLLADVVLKMPYLTYALRLMTPIILLRVWQSILLGYFQGLGSHMPSVVCSVFRQLFFLLFSLLLTGRMVSYGEKVSELLNNADFAGMYGAFALCLSMLIAEILLFIFLLIVFFGSDRSREDKKAEEGLQKKESFRENCRNFYLTLYPDLAVSVLKKLPFLIGVFFLLLKAEDISAICHSYGLFYSCFLCVCAVPVFCVTARMMNMFGRLTVTVKRKEMRSVREIIYAGMHYSWAMGLYLSVLLAVLAPQFGKLLNKSYADMLQKYYTYGAVIIVLIIMNIYLWMVQKVMGGYSVRYISLIVMNLVFGVCYLLISVKSEDPVLAICIAGMIAGVVMLILSAFYVVKKYGLWPDWIRCFVIPLAAVGVMGLVTIGVQKILSPHVANLMCLLLCFAVSVIAYLSVLVITGSIKESETDYVYGPIVKRLFSLIIR